MCTHLRTTIELKLVFKFNENSEAIDALSDADYANELDRKSVTNNLIRVFGNPIIWKSKKQSLVTFTTTTLLHLIINQNSQSVTLISDTNLPLNSK